MRPETLTGRQFESLILRQLRRYHAADLASIGRYGVQAVHRGGHVQSIKSLPDFEGIVREPLSFLRARSVIFDAKACSAASFPLREYDVQNGSKRRQLTHMLDRSRYGVICGFLIHFNKRMLKGGRVPADTYWYPIHHELASWKEHLAGEQRRITRDYCEEFGVRVEWTDEKISLPKMLDAIRAVSGSE